MHNDNGLNKANELGQMNLAMPSGSSDGGTHAVYSGIVVRERRGFPVVQASV